MFGLLREVIRYIMGSDQSLLSISSNKIWLHVFHMVERSAATPRLRKTYLRNIPKILMSNKKVKLGKE